MATKKSQLGTIRMIPPGYYDPIDIFNDRCYKFFMLPAPSSLHPALLNQAPCARTPNFPASKPSNVNRESPVVNPFRIRTSAKSTRNLFRIRTSETKHLKVFRMNTYEKTGHLARRLQSSSLFSRRRNSIHPRSGCKILMVLDCRSENVRSGNFLPRRQSRVARLV